MDKNTNDSLVTCETLIEMPKPIRLPHVVILGAGASLAAMPNGDAKGKPLPLMANLVKLLQLEELIAEAGYDPSKNFEAVYSEMHAADPSSNSVKSIEKRVREYFSSLVLPNYPTIYDHLFLSLRSKDAIFTFNWDPFLADVAIRHGVGYAPHIFHLHGNVRVGYCNKCFQATLIGEHCSHCNVKTLPSRLLYPVAEKNYADDPFIKTQWDQARDFIKRALIITIFGYSAPTTDQEAISIFIEARKGENQDWMADRVEIIDIRNSSELATQWKPLMSYDHCEIRRSFYESRMALYPRRTCESVYYNGTEGKWTETIPWPGNLEGFEASLEKLQINE